MELSYSQSSQAHLLLASPPLAQSEDPEARLWRELAKVGRLVSEIHQQVVPPKREGPAEQGPAAAPNEAPAVAPAGAGAESRGLDVTLDGLSGTSVSPQMTWASISPDTPPVGINQTLTSVESIAGVDMVDVLTSKAPMNRDPNMNRWSKKHGSLAFKELLPPSHARAVSPTLRRNARSRTRTLAAMTLDDTLGPQRNMSRLTKLRDPLNTANLTFKCAGAISLIVDLVITPYMLSWDVSGSGFGTGFTIFQAIFWSLDILSSFWLGYYEDAKLVTAPRKVVRRYVTTWFIPDLSLVLIDYWNILSALADSSSSSSSSIRVVRVAKLGKIFRVMVLLRAMRYITVMQEWADHLLSNSAHSLLSVLKILVATMYFAHFMACSWFAVGTYAGTNTGRRWVDRFEGSSRDHVQEYVVAFQWSMAMVTLGSIDVVCTNTAERVFNIFCLILGLAGSSILVSTLSATMVETQLAAGEKRQMTRLLRKFMHENRVSPKMIHSVSQHVQSRVAKEQPLREQEVKAMELIATSLRGRLRFEIMGKYLTRHPLFRLYQSKDAAWCDRFLVDALSFVHLQAQDDLFVATKAAKGAYSICAGHLMYVQENGRQRISETAWVSEVALFIEWVHCGQLEAQTWCRVLHVSAEGYVKAILTLPNYHIIACLARDYAAQVLRIISTVAHDDMWDDVYSPGLDWRDVVFNMQQHVRREVSLEALETLRTKQGLRLFGGGSIKKLETEILNDKCILLVDALSGDVLRVVEVVVMKVTRDMDSKVLAQIGTFEHGLARAGCMPPGGKREHGETVQQALTRMLAGKYRVLQGSLELMGHIEEIEEKPSSEFGLVTEYRRLVLSARLRGDVALSWQPCQQRTAESSEDNRKSRNKRVSFGPTVSILQSMTTVPAWMLERSVFYVRNDPDYESRSRFETSGTFYAWLEPEEMEHLKTVAGLKELQGFLQELEVCDLELEDSDAAAQSEVPASSSSSLAPASLHQDTLHI